MSDLQENLRSEFQDVDYRYGYAQSFLNTKLATQIKTLREQRGKTQAEVGALTGTKQSGFTRFEDVNHSVWKTDTLWSIARAFGVRLNISFETFGSLLDDKRKFTKENLERPAFESDPAFQEAAVTTDNIKEVAAQALNLGYLSTSAFAVPSTENAALFARLAALDLKRAADAVAGMGGDHWAELLTTAGSIALTSSSSAGSMSDQRIIDRRPPQMTTARQQMSEWAEGSAGQEVSVLEGLRGTSKVSFIDRPRPPRPKDVSVSSSRDPRRRKRYAGR